MPFEDHFVDVASANYTTESTWFEFQSSVPKRKFIAYAAAQLVKEITELTEADA